MRDELVELTDINGEKIIVNTKYVISIYPFGEKGATIRCHINDIYHVKESYEDVRKIFGLGKKDTDNDNN